MVKHKCNICNYETIYPTNYKNHLKSKKHIRNVEKYNEGNTQQKPDKNTTIKKDNIICQYCSCKFTRKSSLHRHLQDNRCIAKLEFEEEKKERDLSI